MQIDLQRLRGDVARRHVRVDADVDPDRPRRDPLLARQLGDDLLQHLDVELEAERGDVAGLLGAEQVAGAADLEVAHRDREAGAELRVVGKRREAGPGLGRQLRRLGVEEVGVRRNVAAADAAADLVELGEAERVGALDDQGVRLRDVEARLDDRRRDEHVGSSPKARNASILSSSSRSTIWPCATSTRAPGQS